VLADALPLIAVIVDFCQGIVFLFCAAGQCCDKQKYVD